MSAVLKSQAKLTDYPMIGRAPAFLSAIELAERWARTDHPIMLIGATGTGKELLARWIHGISSRQGQLVPVNCASLRPELAHGMLFGHRRGAFTGAVDHSLGYYRQADGGTLFLDELTSLPQESQATLLRAVETGEIQPLGGFRILHADVRLVSAVHEDIEQRVAVGELRDDLFQRLAIGVVRLPPLRERQEDIPILASWFASRRGRTLSAAAQEVLVKNHWPGNVRELRAVIEGACVLADGAELDARHIQAMLLARGGVDIQTQGPAAQQAQELELRRRVVAACRAAGGNISEAAARIGTTRSTIYRWLQKWGLSAADFRREGRVGRRA